MAEDDGTTASTLVEGAIKGVYCQVIVRLGACIRLFGGIVLLKGMGYWTLGMRFWAFGRECAFVPLGLVGRVALLGFEEDVCLLSNETQYHHA